MGKVFILSVIEIGKIMILVFEIKKIISICSVFEIKLFVVIEVELLVSFADDSHNQI